jgi:hypothetical protein
MEDWSNSSSYSNAGDFTLVAGSDKLLYSPKISKGNTKIRLCGPVDAAGTVISQIDPTKEGREGIGPAFLRLDYATYVGDKGYHYIVGPPAEGAKKTVHETFHAAIKDYVDAHNRTAPDQWIEWLGMKVEGKEKKRAVLNRSKNCLFVQGYMYMNGGKDVSKRDGKNQPRNVVLALAPSARINVLKMLQTPKDETQALSVLNSRIGDLMSLQGGALLELEQYSQTFSDNKPAQDWTRPANAALPTERADGQPYAPAVLPLTLETNNAGFKPWKEILEHGTPYETQIARLSETFSPAAVDYVFSNHEVYAQYVPAHCLGAFNAMGLQSTQAPAPAAPAVPAAAPAPAAPAATAPPAAPLAPAAPAPVAPAPAAPIAPAATAPVDPATLTPPAPAPAAPAAPAAPVAPAMPATAPPAVQSSQELLQKLQTAQAALPGAGVPVAPVPPVPPVA